MNKLFFHRRAEQKQSLCLPSATGVGTQSTVSVCLNLCLWDEMDGDCLRLDNQQFTSKNDQGCFVTLKSLSFGKLKNRTLVLSSMSNW